jgi:predicted nucleic acid-binding protein
VAKVEARRLALDSSCMVALVSEWHESHLATFRKFHTMLDSGAELLVMGPALVETYSVLTRLPPPRRLSPAEALSIIDTTFGNAPRTVALTPAEYWSLVRRAPVSSIAGGRVYDALIAACARKAAPVTLLTLNAEHFSPFEDGSLRIATP